MNLVIDYFFSPQSPWTYLGHERFAAMAKAAGAHVNVLPVNLGGKVFPVSGGLPLAQRAPQRQAYRLVELKRFSAHLGIALTLHPKFFPVVDTAAAHLITAVGWHDGADAAMALTGAATRAVWREERDIADQSTLAALLAVLGLPAQRLADAQSTAVHDRYDAHTQRAIDTGVFGAPSYVVDGEIFWGQDRLDFLERRLARA